MKKIKNITILLLILCALTFTPNKIRAVNGPKIIDIVVPKEITFQYDKTNGAITAMNYTITNNKKGTTAEIKDVKLNLSNGWIKAESNENLNALPANTKKIKADIKVNGANYDLIQDNLSTPTPLGQIKYGESKNYEIKGEIPPVSLPMNEKIGSIVVAFNIKNDLAGIYTQNGIQYILPDVSMPEPIQEGDTFEAGPYLYTYSKNQTMARGNTDGWNVKVINKTISDFTPYPILEMINGKPVSVLDNAFLGNTNIITAPILPNSIISMHSAFKDCTSLQNPPDLPKNVVDITSAFRNAKSMQNCVELPESVQWMESVFEYCEAMTGVPPAIPANIKNMYHAFYFCWYMTGDININIPEIPANKKDNYRYAFAFTTKYINLITLPNESNRAAVEFLQDFNPNIRINGKRRFNLLAANAMALSQQVETGTKYVRESENITWNENEPMPLELLNGDKLYTNDYLYTYHQELNGWAVEALNKKKTEYEMLKDQINGAPVVDIHSLYEDCIYLQNAPIIHNNITNMSFAFKNCPSLNGNILINANNIINNESVLEGTALDESHKIILCGTEYNKEKLLEIKGNNEFIVLKEENADNNIETQQKQQVENSEIENKNKSENPIVITEENQILKNNIVDNNSENATTENKNNTDQEIVAEDNNRNEKDITVKDQYKEPQDTKENDNNENTQENLTEKDKPIHSKEEMPGNENTKQKENVNNPPEVINYTKKIMVDNVLYKETKQLNNHHDGIITGTLTSSIDGPGDPTINDQSNFGIGFQYTKRETTIEVKIDEKWVVFESEVQNTEPQNDQIAQENTENDLQVQENIPGSNTQPPVNNETLEQVPTESEQNNAQSQNQEKPIIPDATEMEQTQPEQENNNTSENTNKEPENPPESLPEPQTEEKPQQEQPQPQLENSVPSEPPVLEGPPVVEKTQPETPPVEEPVVEEPQQINENPVQEETPQVQEEPTIEPEPPVIEGPIVEEPVA